MARKEIWKDIPNYEGLYKISALGNIKTILFNRFMKFKEDKDGYFVIGLTKNAKQSYFRVHRLVAIAFIKNPLNLPEVNHKDLNKKNNAKWNLNWTTGRKNKHHYHSDSLHNTGIFKMASGKYKTQFTINKKLYYVGTFEPYKIALNKYRQAFRNSGDPQTLLKIISKNRTKHKKNGKPIQQ